MNILGQDLRVTRYIHLKDLCLNASRVFKRDYFMMFSFPSRGNPNGGTAHPEYLDRHLLPLITAGAEHDWHARVGTK